MFDFVASTTSHCHWHDASHTKVPSIRGAVLWGMEAATTTTTTTAINGKSEWISILKNLMGICTERDLTLTCDILHLHTCKPGNATVTYTDTFTFSSHRELRICYSNSISLFLSVAFSALFTKVGKSPKILQRRMNAMNVVQTKWHNPLMHIPEQGESQTNITGRPNSIGPRTIVAKYSHNVVNKYWKIQNGCILWFMFSFWSMNTEDEILIGNRNIFIVVVVNTHQCYHNIDALLSQISRCYTLYRIFYATPRFSQSLRISAIVHLDVLI